MTFGELLSRLRRAQGISQSELARRSGMTSSHVNMIERGYSSGQRVFGPPNRGITERLVRGLALDDAAVCSFLAAAGHACDPIRARGMAWVLRRFGLTMTGEAGMEEG